MFVEYSTSLVDMCVGSCGSHPTSNILYRTYAHTERARDIEAAFAGVAVALVVLAVVHARGISLRK